MTTIKIKIINSEELRKCSKCNSTQLLKYFKINRKGAHNKTCLKCSENAKKHRDKTIELCEHKIRKYKCHICVGGCPHGRIKSNCSFFGCGGCIHNRRKRNCLCRHKTEEVMTAHKLKLDPNFVINEYYIKLMKKFGITRKK